MITTTPGAVLLRRRILSHLRRHGPATSRTLADAVGRSVQTAWEALGVLEGRGEVTRVGRTWSAVDGAAVGAT